MLFFWTFYSSKKPEEFLLSCFQHNNNNNNKNNKHFCAANLNIRMISEASCDWLKLNYEITGIDYILKCIQIENSYFK